MKLTFGIIVFNGDFFLRQVLESIYPYAHAICIAEGPVGWWVGQGHDYSTDNTRRIIDTFPDPDHKIWSVHETYPEKNEQCRAWFRGVPADTDYIICNDADEIHTPENLEKLIRFLETEQPTSVGFKSHSLYGGFERVIGGFELEHSFKRVLKYIPGAVYKTHRQPTLALNGQDIAGKDILGRELYEATGITMWHGSYVSPVGTHAKIRYYEGAVIAPGQCIPDYFNQVWLPWVTRPEDRLAIESKYRGVQEFMPSARGDCFTIPFPGTHPAIIERDMPLLLDQFNRELKRFTA
jgi:hypothetical protein